MHRVLSSISNITKENVIPKIRVSSSDNLTSLTYLECDPFFLFKKRTPIKDGNPILGEAEVTSLLRTCQLSP